MDHAKIWTTGLESWLGKTLGGEAHCPLFNNSNGSSQAETISGRVVSFEQVGPGNSTWLKMKTDAGTVNVHLGPMWYLESQKIAIAKNNMITVAGFSNTLNKKTTFIASELKYANQKIPLRDESGYPLWRNGTLSSQSND